METDAIEAFVKIARLGTFGRAARALHRTQPAISRRIERLEDEVGAPLLERVPGGVSLTEAGRALLPFAEAALAAFGDGAASVQAVRRGEHGVLALAIVGTLAGTSLIQAIRSLRRTHPGVRLDLQTATSAEVGALVRRGEAALGLRYHPDPSPQLISRPVANETFLPICAADHPLGRRRGLSPRALTGQRWVAFRAGASRAEPFMTSISRGLAAAGLHDAEIVPIDSLTAQKRLVEAGFGIAILPGSGIQEELRASTLRVLDVPGLVTEIPVCAVYRRGGFLSPAAEVFLARLGAQPLEPTALPAAPRRTVSRPTARPARKKRRRRP